jgi:hypothetical protein
VNPGILSTFLPGLPERGLSRAPREGPGCPFLRRSRQNENINNREFP